MNLVVSGCSHSTWLPKPDGSGLDSKGKIYSQVLADMLQSDYINLSDIAKDNRQIIADAIKHICLSENIPGILVIQLTEFERMNFFKTSSHEDYNPSKSFDYIKNWMKFNPACLSHEHRPLIHFDGAIDGYQDIHIGHPQALMEQIQVLLDIISLQALCKQFGIQLYILNWHGFTQIYKIPTGIINTVNWDNFLLNNIQYDWPNHLHWNDFITPIDHSHFCADAHEYIAQRLYKLIVHNEKTIIESEPNPQYTKPIYDYTN
jgi:hypothetical protein